MKAPTSTYGCGAHSCEECYGDEEWRVANLPDYCTDPDEEDDDE